MTSNSQYPGVAELFRYTLPRFGIESTAVDASDPDAIQAALRPGSTNDMYLLRQ